MFRSDKWWLNSLVQGNFKGSCMLEFGNTEKRGEIHAFKHGHRKKLNRLVRLRHSCLVIFGMFQIPWFKI